MQQLAKALCSNITVTKLRLGREKLDGGATRALGEVLKNNQSLEQLT